MIRFLPHMMTSQSLMKAQNPNDNCIIPLMHDNLVIKIASGAKTNPRMTYFDQLQLSLRVIHKLQLGPILHICNAHYTRMHRTA